MSMFTKPIKWMDRAEWAEQRRLDTIMAARMAQKDAERLHPWRDVEVSKEIVELHGLVMPWEREQNGGCNASELCSDGDVPSCCGGVCVEHDKLRRRD